MPLLEVTLSEADGTNADVSTIEMEEFIALNNDGNDDEMPARVRGLPVGETLWFGGGAACLAAVKLLS